MKTGRNTMHPSLSRWILPLALAAAATWAQASSAAPQDEAAAGGQDQEQAGDEENKDGEKEAEKDPLNAGALSGFKFRSIGPALTSGRIGDIAVDPANPSLFYVAVASGGVFKTDNYGTTWKPVFDGEASYSIGCITLEPGNPSVVWVGSGENNSQRSVSFGDGVYKSVDGGAHWKNMGLKESEHVGRIAIHPSAPDTIFVAAQGPLWRPGGDRGVYRSKDGGATWEHVLEFSENTGANEVHIDPRDPRVLYASAYQRRRHVWTLIDGGPESAIWKSTDGGDTWRKASNGLPSVDKGRIGMAISPADPEAVYAIVEAAEGKGGVFRSTDRGENWRKQSSHMTTSPQYYNELVCDPKDPDRVYSLDTRLHVSEDGGRTWQPVPGRDRHVDDHALWIDPADTDRMIVGCDGGVYMTWDRGANWAYCENLPVTQFYRVAVDESRPFYFVYGGTQDNNTLGGPSRTISRAGIANEDWFVTVGGDGFEPQVDPVDPNIVYSQWQHGGLVRYDRKSGERVDIKPREAPGEPGLKWNWDSPLLISPHSHTRLYFAANVLYRSEDRGDSWRKVSGDLTRGIDRNTLEVMGKIQDPDAVAKHMSTSLYGNAVALTESPLTEDLLYAGTDDGLIHVSPDGGATWERFATFPGVPEMTYVSELEASRHQPDRVFAAFDNHKNGDFKPYLLKSEDRGRTWVSIAGDLPERNIVYCVGEDHVNPDLLFCGTEFGLYVTFDGGTKWLRMKSGLPTISVKDLEIQRREDDLVLATFGRGFYVLDDYSPLRNVTREQLESKATLFPVKDALQYVQTGRMGGGRGSQGATYFTAPNPPYGAIITYHVGDKPKTQQEERKEAEKKLRKDKQQPPYPTLEQLRAEDREATPAVFLTVTDESGATVRRIEASRQEGFHRVAWDLRHASLDPPGAGARRRGGASEEEEEEEEGAVRRRGGSGPMVLPGRYSVTLAKELDGLVETLAGPEWFEVIPLELATLAAKDRAEVTAFRLKVLRLQGAVRGAQRTLDDTQSRLGLIRAALLEAKDSIPAQLETVRSLERRLDQLRIELNGDPTLGKRLEPEPPSISERVSSVAGNQWNTTQPPTTTERDAYRHAGEAFARVLDALRRLVETDLAALEAGLDAAGAPWTPGRVPTWQIE